MRARGRSAVLLVSLLTLGSPIDAAAATVVKWVEGSACKRGSDERLNSDWTFPVVRLASPTATAEVNQAIVKYIHEALGMRRLPASSKCKEIDNASPDELLHSYVGTSCKTTYLSDRFVSLDCGTEHTVDGKGGTEYRPLLFRVTRNGHAEPFEPFRDQNAEKAITAILVDFIRSDREGSNDSDPNGSVDDDEIPGLAARMLRSVTFSPEGLHFIVLGNAHSAFEMTLDLAHARRWLPTGLSADLDGAAAETKHNAPANH